MKTVAVSGGFDPLHIGHVRYLEEAHKIAGHLTVILNGDSFLVRKKGFAFMPQEQRAEILRALRCVDDVVIFESEQDTVVPALEVLAPDIFAKGGDRGADNTPEAAFCEAHGIQIVYGVGGTDKPQSSQWLTSKIKETKHETSDPGRP